MSEARTEARPFGAWERRIASRYISARRDSGGVTLISTISFIGILLAVAILIIVMSVMNGFRNELLNRILGVNGHIYVDTQTLPIEKTNQIIINAKKIEGVKSIAPLVQGQVLIVGGPNARGAVVQGTRREDLLGLELIAKNLVGGSLQNYGIGEYGGDEIIIGTKLAANLQVLPGDYVELLSPNGASTAFGTTPRSKEYRVGAIFDVGMSEYDGVLIYMPLEQAQLFLGRENAIDMLEARIKDPDNTNKTVNEFIAMSFGAAVTDWKQRSDFVQQLGVERVVMRLILMMLILIASLNIISGLVMLVKNKGRDIAVLRTMGASQGAIARIFLMIGASIGISGTIAGVLLGTLICVNIEHIQAFIEKYFGQVFPDSVYFLSQIPAHVEWSEVYITASFALVMSIIVTLPPALRAARLDPVEALRYE